MSNIPSEVVSTASIEADITINQADIDTNANNNLILALKHAIANNLSYYGMDKLVVDEYEDETGVDTGSSSNQVYNASGDYYEPTVAVPAYTTYDGNDSYKTSDATWRFSGDQTWCCEVNIPSLPGSGSFSILDTVKGSENKGARLELQYNGGTEQYVFSTYPDAKTSTFTITTEFNQWVKLVGVADEGGNVTLYVDGVAGSSTAMTTVTASTFDFFIGRFTQTSSNYLTGSVRNVEIYSGVPVDASLWVPGTTSSMTGQGCTLVDTSVDGSGTDSGVTFTIEGDPVITAFVAGLNMTFFSNTVTAATAPASGRAVVLHEPVDSVTINTDLIASLTRDGSAYEGLTLTDVGPLVVGGTVNLLVSGKTTITTTTGTSVGYKLVTANTKAQKIHGTGFAYGA